MTTEIELEQLSERVEKILKERLPRNKEIAITLRNVLSLLHRDTDFVNITDADIIAAIDKSIVQEPIEDDDMRTFRPEEANQFAVGSKERDLLDRGYSLILDKFGSIVHTWKGLRGGDMPIDRTEKDGLSPQQVVRYIAGLKPLVQLLDQVKKENVPTLLQPLVDNLAGLTTLGAAEGKPFGVTLKSISKQLKEVTDPSPELISIIELLEKEMAKSEDTTKAKYGVVVNAEILTKLLQALTKLEDKPQKVQKAIKLLKHMLGDETTETPNLPAYCASQLSVTDKPGVYFARFIRAGKALDGKVWREDALQRAANSKLFEGVPINVITFSGSYGDIDHHLPTDVNFTGDISGNQIGFAKNVNWNDVEKAVFGFVYITDPTRRALIDAALAEGLTPPGMSIYCSGSLGKDDYEVENIDHVYSMDLVTFPAADGAILSHVLQAAMTDSMRVPKQDKPLPASKAGVATDSHNTITTKPLIPSPPKVSDEIQNRVTQLEAAVQQSDMRRHAQEKLAVSGLPEKIKNQIEVEIIRAGLTKPQIDEFIKYNLNLVNTMAAGQSQVAVANNIRLSLKEETENNLKNAVARALGVNPAEGE